MASLKISIPLSFMVICILIVQISSISYCGIKTCSKEAQTLCKFRNSKYGYSCGSKNFIKSGLNDRQITEILRVHNNLRDYVAKGKEKRGHQPPAKNMNHLEWDPELAKVAQKWADQCIPGHDECRNVERFKVGQNAGYESHSRTFPNNLTAIMYGWYDEVAEFDRNMVKKLKMPRAMVLHYTQMVWAETTNIGCGLIKYKNGFWYTMNLVCNYGPQGNIIGQPVYKT